MNRYLAYLLFFNMLTNVVSQATIILLEERYNGAVSSLLLSVPIGATMVAVFIWLFARLPRQGLPEIVYGAMPRWIGAPFLAAQALLWFVCGFVVLLYIAEVTKRFINPDFAPVEALALILAVVVLFVNLTSMRVLYLLEMTIVISVPFILFIVGKAAFSENLMVDSMLEAFTHGREMPSLLALNASLFVFSGFMTLCIFNRVIAPNVRRGWYLAIVALIGGLNLLLSFFVPIGFHGADGALTVTYPWFATADALRLQFGFIERLLFMFLLLYLLISVVAIIVYWHVGLEIWKSLLPRRIRSAWIRMLFPYSIVAGLAFGSIYIDLNYGLEFLRQIARVWMTIQLPNTVLVLGVVAFAAYRAVRKEGKAG